MTDLEISGCSVTNRPCFTGHVYIGDSKRSHEVKILDGIAICICSCCVYYLTLPHVLGGPWGVQLDSLGNKRTCFGCALMCKDVPMSMHSFKCHT